MINLFKLIFFPLFALIILTYFANTAYAISLDPTFGTNGKVITSFGNQAIPQKTVIQSDGKAVVVGRVLNSSNNGDWAIVRYEANGSLDMSFGNNGIILKDFGGHYAYHDDFLKGVILQPDGKIVVGGSSTVSSENKPRWTLARYDLNGNIDTSFGTNGIVITTIRNGYSIEYITDLILQPDNKIVAVGVSHTGDTDVALARYNPDGTLDNTFGGGDGIVTTSIGGSNDRGGYLAIQPDSKIVVLGTFDVGGHDEVFIARYNENGDLDSAFGSGGKVIDRYGFHNGVDGLILDTNGKIMVAGGVVNHDAGNTYVARYNSNGSLDGSFGGGKIIPFPVGTFGVRSILLQADGKILLGGVLVVNGNYDLGLKQLNPNGTIDTTFGDNGSFSTPIGQANEEIYTMALQTDGKIVAAGYTVNGSYSDWVVVRFGDINNEPLNVPYFSQNYDEVDSPWGDDEYDHAISFGDWSNTTMDRWGCAVTSAAMVLRYHGMNELEDGTPIDPGSLNEWLKKNEGFLTGFGTDGSYSYINWDKIASLSAELYKKNKSPTKLEFDYKDAGPETGNEILDDDLLNIQIPDILWVKKLSPYLTSSHFVVAKGKIGDIYAINDPEWDYSELSFFDNTYQRIVRFVPSSTDLGYIVVVTGDSVNLSLTDVNGDEPVGLIKTHEDPINNGGENMNAGTGVNVIYLPKPQDGQYKITALSNDPEYFILNVAAFDQDGNMMLDKSVGFSDLGPENSYSFNFNYSKTDTSTTFRPINWDSVVQDVDELHALNLITKDSLVRRFVHNLDQAQIGFERDKEKLMDLKLDHFERLLNRERGNKVNEEAYQILLDEIKYLRLHPES